MNIATTTLAAAALALTTAALAPVAAAGPMAPHETTYHGPAGFQMTLGHTDESYRQVPALNAMPTNRQFGVFDLDPERVAARICAATGGALTEQIWARHLPNVTYRPPCS
ncbi:hypothetical protein [Nocardia rhizosphaerae]|uniref:Secreted protein n=1 Tax=Nocardia rhizosphaerae TaxID=1691571 RepID=A0ABV8L2V7_9NOCA